MAEKPFSKQFSDWLNEKKPKTVGSLSDAFSEKSFAILFLVLMTIPALPLPTGGLTHVFEVMTMLLALELIAGRRSVWLPRRWRKIRISAKVQKTTLSSLVRGVRKLEKYSRPRWHSVLHHSLTNHITGVIVLILALFAFFAPPFSALDTLPSLGVVLISLAIILDDFAIYILGLVTGSVGVGLVIILGKFLYKAVSG